MNELDKYSPSVVVDGYETTAGPAAAYNVSLIKPILQHWKLAVLTFIMVAGLGVPLAWFSIKPTYATVGTIQVAPILTNILTGQADRGEVSNYEMFVNTQARLMASDRVLQRVADELQSKKLTMFQDSPDTILRLRDMLQNESIAIAPLRKTELIELRMESGKADEAEHVINAIIRAYMEIVGTSALEGGNRQLTLLMEERRLLSEKLENQRRAIQQIAAEYGSESLGGHQNISLQRVMALQTELTNLEIRRMNYQTQLQLLIDITSKTLTGAELITMRNNFINNDPILQQLSGNIARVQQEYSDLEQTLATTNPYLKQKAKALEDIKKNLQQRQDELRRQFEEIMSEDEKKIHNDKVKELQAEVEKTEALEKEYRRKLNEEDENYRKYGYAQQRIADQQAQLAQDRERYDVLGKRVYDLEMEQKRPARISVAQEATSSLPQSKRIKAMAMIACGALALGIGLAFLRGKADHSMYTPEDVIRCIGLPMIGTTISADKRQGVLPSGAPNDYDAIRANLRLLNDGVIPKRLVVTSAAAGEGKTTFSINLAISLAQSGYRVLLIDGDLRKPDVAGALHLTPRHAGLESVLLDNVDLAEALHHTSVPTLEVLCNHSRRIADVMEVLGKPDGIKIIEAIGMGYDHVIIDTPPVLAAPDALTWAKTVDAVVLSSQAGQTISSELQETLERLSRLGVRVLGNVLSNVKIQNSYHRYGYHYGYGKNPSSNKGKAARPLLLSQDDLNAKTNPLDAS